MPTIYWKIFSSVSVNNLECIFICVMTMGLVIAVCSLWHSQLSRTKVSDIIQLKLLIFVYEAVNNIISSCFHEFFTCNSTVHSYNTRQSHRGDIFMVQTNSSLYGLKSIRYLGAKSWNELPMEIRKVSSKKVFKKKLKAYLIDSMQ